MHGRVARWLGGWVVGWCGWIGCWVDWLVGNMGTMHDQISSLPELSAQLQTRHTELVRMAAKVVKQVHQFIETKFGGSGDLDVMDAVHCSEYYSTKYGSDASPFKGMIQEVMRDLERLDPMWAQRHKATLYNTNSKINDNNKILKMNGNSKTGVQSGWRVCHLRLTLVDRLWSFTSRPGSLGSRLPTRSRANRAWWL